MLEKLQHNLSQSATQLFNTVKDASHETNNVSKTNFKPNVDFGNSATSNTLNEFGDMLKQQLNNVNALDNKADSLAKAYALGEPVPLHQVMIAGEKASIAMELTLQVRNKLIQAYQDMMRMPL